MKIFWTREALARLREINSYISKDNPEASEVFVNDLVSAAESLAQYPERGRVVPELTIETIRELIYKNYRIVYLIKKKSIEILTVFEGHRLLKRKEISRGK
jgi:addiction module RelE/StbE family toxin